MGATNVTLAASLLAGLISFFSPCVLPLVPIYLGYMTGTAANLLDTGKRLTTLVHAMFFVLGFGILFVALGATAGFLGSFLYPIMPYIVRIGGIILIIFGLHLMQLISIPFLNMDKRFDLQGERPRNYWTSFLIGIVFAAGWTPCVGPVLSSILLLAADSQTVSQGALLLTFYAVGLGLPFLAVAVLVDIAIPALKRLTRYLRIISIAGGFLLIVMGFLMVVGLFDQFVAWFNTLGLQAS